MSATAHLTAPPGQGPRPFRDRVLGGESPGAWIGQRGVYVALVVLVLYNAVDTPNFVSVENAALVLTQVTPVLIVSLGMALVIGTGGVDLSVGATMAIASAVLAKFVGSGSSGGMATSFLVAAVAAVAAGVLVGVFNGTVIAVGRVQPIVATLALLVGGRGVALVITSGALVPLSVPFFTELRRGSFLGLPGIAWFAGALGLLVSLLVRRTAFGYRLLAIGGNRRASVLAGLPVRRTLITVYAITGGLAAVAGIIATARLRASDPSFVGLLIELSAITAVVVGGTSLNGGRVRILGTVVGAILIQLLTNTLVAHGAPPSFTRIVQGVIIVAAVYVQRVGRRGL